MHAGDIAIFGRLAVASGLGFAAGYQREIRGQVAGDRTFALVSMGAAAFTAIGVEMFPASAEKVIAGVVTGVGFIGAGLVFQRNETLTGLTTAAAIWAIAAVGVIAGVGRLVLAILATALILITLELRHIPFLRILDARRYVDRMTEEE